VIAVFADTSFYLAFLNPDDEFHSRSVEFTSSFNGKMLTTTWVLTELVDALSRPADRQAVVDFVAELQVDPQVVTLSAHQTLFDLGFELFRRLLDKYWSLTDCISFAVMEQQRLTSALTSDHHFEQAGFQVLF
jgi:uncharacterized protein